MNGQDATDACHCTLLRKAARRVSSLYDSELAGTGLRITQYALLAQIDRSGPLSITDLADIMVMERNGLGHNLRLMERDGLVRSEAGRDRRRRVVALTDMGRRRLDQVRPRWEQAQRRIEATGLMGDIRQPLGALIRSDLAAS